MAGQLNFTVTQLKFINDYQTMKSLVRLWMIILYIQYSAKGGSNWSIYQSLQRPEKGFYQGALVLAISTIIAFPAGIFQGD